MTNDKWQVQVFHFTELWVAMESSEYKKVQVVAVNIQCPHRTATIQVCDLITKAQNGDRLVVKAPTTTAKNFKKGQKYIIEYKHSFIGQSLSRYRQDNTTASVRE